MTENEFKTMLTGSKTTLKSLFSEILAEGLAGGYYTSQYSGEEIDQAIGRALPNGVIDEDLSNKVDSNIISMAPPETLDAVLALEKGNAYGWIQSQRFDWQPEDFPNNTVRVVFYYKNQSSVTTADMYLRVIDGGSNRKYYYGEYLANLENPRWEKVHTTTQPAKYILPLAEEFIADGVNSYFKTQDGCVTVMVGAKGVTPTALTTIATLPVGFRPSAVCRGIFTSSTNDTARVLVLPGGEIRCQFSTSVDTFFGGGFSFLAGG